jgi:hypothetical protein
MSNGLRERRLSCTVIHCTVLYCTVLYCTVLFCAASYPSIAQPYCNPSSLPPFLCALLLLPPSSLFLIQGNVSSNFFARGFGVKNEGNLPANLQSNRLSPPSLTLKGAAAETAMFTVLEGVSGGLDALIATLKKNGDWPRVRAIRDKLIEVFAAIAVDVYAYQEGMHCLCCIKVDCSVLSLRVLCCTALPNFHYSTALCVQ